MTSLYHRECGGPVAAGFQVTLRVLTFSIIDRTLNPGAVEARPRTVSGDVVADGQTCTVGFFCTRCGANFNSKDELRQLEASCGHCGKKHPVEEMCSTAYTPVVGEACLTEILASPTPVVPANCRRVNLLGILSNKSVAI